MTSGLWLASGLVLALLAGGWMLMRKAAQAERGKALEDENSVRNEARDARHRLDHAERERLRKKFGKRRDV